MSFHLDATPRRVIDIGDTVKNTLAETLFQVAKSAWRNMMSKFAINVHRFKRGSKFKICQSLQFSGQTSHLYYFFWMILRLSFFFMRVTNRAFHAKTDKKQRHISPRGCCRILYNEPIVSLNAPIFGPVSGRTYFRGVWLQKNGLKKSKINFFWKWRNDGMLFFFICLLPGTSRHFGRGVAGR